MTVTWRKPNGFNFWAKEIGLTVTYPKAVVDQETIHRTAYASSTSDYLQWLRRDCFSTSAEFDFHQIRCMLRTLNEGNPS